MFNARECMVERRCVVGREGRIGSRRVADGLELCDLISLDIKLVDISLHYTKRRCWLRVQLSNVYLPVKYANYITIANTILLPQGIIYLLAM